MGTRIVEPSAFTRHKSRGMNIQIGSQSRSYQDDKRMQQRYDRSDFHFASFHLVAHEFRSSAYHQPADKYSDDEERKVIHPAYADTTDPRINLHVQHFYPP